MKHIQGLIINGLKIDPKIFTRKFVQCCDISKCCGVCCSTGVYADKLEYENILSIKDRIIDSMDETQPKNEDAWFSEPISDIDFPSGIKIGINHSNAKCVFQDKNAVCTIQKLSKELTGDPWKYKPYYCIIFPLVDEDKTLTIDNYHLKRIKYCGLKEEYTSTIFEACRCELEYALGSDGLEKLVDYYEQFIKK
jgi:hypothetical protein